MIRVAIIILTVFVFSNTFAGDPDLDAMYASIKGRDCPFITGNHPVSSGRDFAECLASGGYPVSAELYLERAGDDASRILSSKYRVRKIEAMLENAGSSFSGIPEAGLVLNELNALARAYAYGDQVAMASANEAIRKADDAKINRSLSIKKVFEILGKIKPSERRRLVYGKVILADLKKKPDSRSNAKKWAKVLSSPPAEKNGAAAQEVKEKSTGGGIPPEAAMIIHSEKFMRPGIYEVEINGKKITIQSVHVR